MYYQINKSVLTQLGMTIGGDFFPVEMRMKDGGKSLPIITLGMRMGIIPPTL